MSNIIQNRIKKIQTYLANHKKTRIFVEYLFSLLGTLLSATLFAFSFRTFLSPNVSNVLTIISGGGSGLARTVACIATMINKDSDTYLIYSIANIVINIPVIYIAMRFVSFRFGMFTLINVVTVSLLTKFVDLKFIDSLAQNIACVITDSSGNVFQAGLMARAVLGALFSGLSSSLAFAVGASNGGSDTIGYYLSMRKSTSAGKYFVMINSVIIGLFSILSVFESISIYGSFSSVYIANAFIIILFGVVYQLVISLVVDLINRRNKKEQIQIITKQENLSKLLLANIPHGATLVRSKGAFTGEERIIIYIIVSIHETRNVVNLVRSADPKSFINITSVKQVYGRFFIKPIK